MKSPSLLFTQYNRAFYSVNNCECELLVSAGLVCILIHFLVMFIIMVCVAKYSNIIMILIIAIIIALLC